MNSTPKTQGGWKTFGINVQRLTMGEEQNSNIRQAR